MKKASLFFYFIFISIVSLAGCSAPSPNHSTASSVPEISNLEEDSTAQTLSLEESFSKIEEESTASDKELMLEAYRQIVAGLEEEHGKSTGQADGLCMVKLIDFDFDGTDELFCSWTVTQYARYMNEIYQWQNGTAVRILQETGANRGTSVQPVAIFYVGEDKAYILYGHEYRYEYKSLVDGEMVTAATLVADVEGGDITFYFNQVPYSQDEFQEVLNAFLKDMECLQYSYIPVDSPLAQEFPPVSIEMI